jgi:uncharacterized membrane protein YqjE
MLVSVLLIIYNLSIAFAAGVVFTRLLSKICGIATAILHPTLYVIIGWGSIAMLLQVYHLFFPVNLFAHIYIWLSIVILATGQFKMIAKDVVSSLHQISSKKHIAVGLGFLILVLINIVSRKADGDIGDYHLQAIRWIEEYAAVPGIGNIRRQLGNNSNWFLLQAFGGLHFLGIRSVYTLNASLVIMAALYVTPHLKQHFWLRNFLLLFYFAIVATRKYTGGVTNDISITIGIIILFCWFTDIVNNHNKKAIELLLLLALTMLLITYKLSALPMVLFAIGVFFYAFKQQLITIRIIYFIIGIGVLVFIPWFITNVIHSGYLLFPVTSSNFFDVDWKMRPEIVAYEVYANLAYARAPDVDIEVSRYYSFSQWWPHWIKSIDVFSFILLGGGLFFYITLFTQWLTNKRFRNQFSVHYYWIIASTCMVALVLWFTHGPTPRFVFGYLVFTITMGVNLFHQTTLQQLLYKHKFSLVATLLIVLIASSVKNQITNQIFSSSLIMPPGYLQPEIQKFAVNGGALNVPLPKQQCWDSKLPCTNLPDSGIQYRGTTLNQGFRIKTQH